MPSFTPSAFPPFSTWRCPSVLVSFLNSLLAAYSQGYVVILGIYYKLQTFLYLPAGGIVQGMRPLISYNYGAGGAWPREKRSITLPWV